MFKKIISILATIGFVIIAGYALLFLAADYGFRTVNKTLYSQPTTTDTTTSVTKDQK